MKKVLLVLIAALAFSCGAYAQRHNTGYAGIGIASNLRSAEEGLTGPTLTGGFRNYNRYSPVSFTAGAEGFFYYIPSRSINAIGAFAIPEIGLAIGAPFFKVFFHSGVMIGYDSAATNSAGEKQGFVWGGKDGLAFEFGQHVTLDFSVYVPHYNFNKTLFAVNFIWRFN